MIVFHNTLEQWAIAIGVTVSALTILLVGKRVIIARLRRRPESVGFPWEDAAVALAKQTRTLSLVLASITLGARLQDLPDRFNTYLDRFGFLILLFQLLVWGTVGIGFIVDYYVGRANGDGARTTSVKAIGFLSRLLFLATVILWGLDNFGVNITTLIAGLGVGGVAVALATQNILGDLFASLTIVLDKPFVIGDFIVVDTFSGTIENVGLKTTRVRSVDGEQLIFPNANLLQSRLRNYKRMMERRAVFTFSIAYGTSADLLEKLPAEVKAIVEEQPRIRFDRAHLRHLGANSLDFEVVYWVLSPEFNLYADTQQRVNLALYRRFAALGIDLAGAAPKAHKVQVKDIAAVLGAR